MGKVYRTLLILMLLAAGLAVCAYLDMPAKRFCDAYVTKRLIKGSHIAEQVVYGFQDFAQAVPILAICWAVWRLDRRRGRTGAARLLCAVLAAGLAAALAKGLVGRYRPWAFKGEHWSQAWIGFAPSFRPARESAFFSGHASTAFAMAGVLAGSYPPLSPVVYTLAAGCALARVATAQHWLSDVFLGAVVGLCIARLFSARPGRSVTAGSG